MILLWNRIHFDGPRTVLVYAQPGQCTEEYSILVSPYCSYKTMIHLAASIAIFSDIASHVGQGG